MIIKSIESDLSKDANNKDSIIYIDIIMGSKNDMPVMEEAKKIIQGISRNLTIQVEVNIKIVSAHRTPLYMYEYCKNTKSAIIIAGAGGAAHLPSMVAGLSKKIVIGVPIEVGVFNGVDSFMSICQSKNMKNIPIAMPINGADSAGLMVMSILSLKYKEIQKYIKNYISINSIQ